MPEGSAPLERANVTAPIAPLCVIVVVGYGVPTVPPLNDTVDRPTLWQLTVTVKACTLPHPCLDSVARIEIGKVPGVVGVPEKVPLAKVTPAGSPPEIGR